MAIGAEMPDKPSHLGRYIIFVSHEMGEEVVTKLVGCKEYRVMSELLRRSGERKLRAAVTVKIGNAQYSNQIIEGLSKKILICM
jgi:hypothetical protein